MSGTIAKVFGWLTFLVTSIPLVIQQTTPAGQAQPHGAAQWLVALGGLLAAIGIHAASKSGPPTS